MFEPKPLSDEEAERAVLGGMMEDSRSIPSVLELIGTNPEVFAKSPHQIIFSSIVDLYNQSEPIDPLTVATLINNKGLLGRIGGATETYDLQQSTPSVENIGYYAAIILEKYNRRKLVDNSKKINALAKDTSIDISDVMNQCNDMMFDMSLDRRRDGFNLTSSLNSLVEQLEDKYIPKKRLWTGFSDIDEMTGGLEEGEMMILAGSTSMGKSTVAHNIALHLLHKDMPVIFFMYEMNDEQLLRRMISSISGVDYLKILHKKISGEEKQKVLDAKEYLSTKRLRIYAKSLLPDEIKTTIKSAQQDLGSFIVNVIDYAQLVPLSKNMDAMGTYERTTRVSEQIKNMAQDLQVPIILLSQLSRKPDNRASRKPELTDLKNSGSLENDASIVLMLHRNGKVNRSMPDDKIEIMITKARHGQLGSQTYKWEGSTYKVGEPMLI